MQQETIIQFTVEHRYAFGLMVGIIGAYWALGMLAMAGRADRQMEQFEADGLDPAAARQGRTDSLCAPSVPPSGDQKSGGEVITRCRWCENRIGRPMYKLDGYWVDFGLLGPEWFLGYKSKITDGICPDCLTVEKNKMKPAAGKTEDKQNE